MSQSVLMPSGWGILARRAAVGRLIAVWLLLTLAAAAQSARASAATGSADSDLVRGVQLFQGGPRSAAIAFFQGAEHRHPEDARIANALANALFADDQLAAAAAEYRRSLRLDPHLGAAWRNLALLEYRRRNWRAAEGDFNQAVRSLPADPVVWRFLGKALAEDGRWPEAATSLQHSLSLEPDFATRLALARALAMAGQPQLAEATLSAVQATGTEAADRDDLLGWIEQQSHHSGAAATAYRDAIYAAPQRSDSYLHLSWLYAESRHFAEAEQTLREALRFVADRYALQVQLGTVLALEGHEGEALSVLGTAITEQPHNPLAYTTLIIADTLADPSLEKAMATAETAMRQAEPDYLVHYLYAGVLLRRDRQHLDEPALAAERHRIEAELRASIRLNPDFPHAYYDLARLAFDARDYSAAEHYAAATLKADNSFTSAHYLLGQSYLKQGRRDAGLAEIKLVAQERRQELQRIQSVGENLLNRQVSGIASSAPPALH